MERGFAEVLCGGLQMDINMNTSSSQWFSADYAAARDRFRASVAENQGKHLTIDLDTTGPNQEDLTIDIGWFGASTPKRVLLHTSGLHGIEGFAGSAIQLACMARDTFDLDDGDAIVFVHILNPYGMAWLRRVNESNVDLNRNFLPAGRPYRGASDGYRTMNTVLNPETPPSFDFFLIRALGKILRHGYTTLKQAITEGQYAFEKGLFFGGRKLEQGPRLYTQWLENNLTNAVDVFTVDVHTGLGKPGVDTLLVDLNADDPEFIALEKTFGEHVASWDAGSSVAYQIHGGHPSVIGRVLPGTKVRFLTQEFGTIKPLKVLHALREENRWHHYGSGSIDHEAKAGILNAFRPSSAKWDADIIARGTHVYEEVKRQVFV